MIKIRLEISIICKKILLIAIFLLPINLLSAQDIVTISFMGDIMQHKEQLISAHIPTQDSISASSYNYNSYFKHIKKIINNTDLAVANMEFSCSTAPYTGYPNFSAPASLAKEAYESGIDVFLCANNHICDRYKKGILNTINTYKELGVKYTGVYDNPEEKRYLIIEIKSLKFALINFTYGINGHHVPKGCAVNMIDTCFLKKTIVQVKQEFPDYIIALPHWGQEYKILASAKQKKLKDFLYTQGVDIIIGGHPHVIQQQEIKKDSLGFPIKICYYSLGNLISNMSAVNTELGLIYTLTFYKNRISKQTHIIKTQTIPIWCTRAGKLEKGFSIISINDYLNKNNKFLDINNYYKMEKTYNRLKNIIENE
ncbi:MAG: CapA family protein [Bacteroidales bacterium]